MYLGSDLFSLHFFFFKVSVFFFSVETGVLRKNFTGPGRGGCSPRHPRGSVSAGKTGRLAFWGVFRESGSQSWSLPVEYR